MVGEACLPGGAWIPWTPGCALSCRDYVCSSEHSDLSFVYQFMSLIYVLATLTTYFPRRWQTVSVQ